MNAGNGMRERMLFILDRLRERFESMTPLVSPERGFMGRWTR